MGTYGVDGGDEERQQQRAEQKQRRPESTTQTANNTAPRRVTRLEADTHAISAVDEIRRRGAANRKASRYGGR